MRNHRTIHIESSIKHRLSLECRDNFLQFIMVQKAGKVGDVNLLQHLKTVYPKQLDAKNTQFSCHIPYLNHSDESEKELKKQAKMVLTSRRHTQTERPRSKLDDVIKKPLKLPPVCMITTVDKFNI